MSRRHLLALLALSAIWGASFMFIKIGVREFDPFALIFVRIALAALTLIPIVALRMPLRQAFERTRPVAGPLVVVGLVNSAVPFWLIAWAEQRIDSGLTAILQACAPLFTAVLAWLFSHSERVTGMRLAGVVIGFVGVAVLVADAPGGNSGDLLAALATVGAGLSYAAAGLYSSAQLRGVPPLLVAAGAMVAATLITMPLGLARMPEAIPGWKATLSVVVLGVVGTGVAYILYFALIAGAGASKAILVTYLVPSLALLYGVTLLDEALTLVAVAGLALILGGVALGTGTVGARRLAVTRLAAK
jgi:drug/metabolite transporter (DMT)-like permease